MSGGRPSEYSAEICARICAEISSTNNSIDKICRNDLTLPAARTVFYWLHLHPEFLQQYTRAKEAQAELLADEMIEIADDCGKTSDEIKKAALRIDTRKFVAVKLLPKKYGDKMALEHGGKIQVVEIERFGEDTDTAQLAAAKTPA